MSDQLSEFLADLKSAVSNAERAAWRADDAAAELESAAAVLHSLGRPGASARIAEPSRLAEEIHLAHDGKGAARFCSWRGCAAVRDYIAEYAPAKQATA